MIHWSIIAKRVWTRVQYVFQWRELIHWENESCQNCGHCYKYTWTVSDVKWREVVCSDSGLLCFDCFVEMANRQGIMLQLDDFKELPQLFNPNGVISCEGEDINARPSDFGLYYSEPDQCTYLVRRLKGGAYFAQEVAWWDDTWGWIASAKNDRMEVSQKDVKWADSGHRSELINILRQSRKNFQAIQEEKKQCTSTASLMESKKCPDG